MSATGRTDMPNNNDWNYTIQSAASMQTDFMNALKKVDYSAMYEVPKNYEKLLAPAKEMRDTIKAIFGDTGMMHTKGGKNLREAFNALNKVIESLEPSKNETTGPSTKIG
jgi:hypothetical protein